MHVIPVLYLCQIWHPFPTLIQFHKERFRVSYTNCIRYIRKALYILLLYLLLNVISDSDEDSMKNPTEIKLEFAHQELALGIMLDKENTCVSGHRSDPRKKRLP